MKVTLKEIFESDMWIITKVLQGSGIVRIDAKRRFPMADVSNFFSNWGSVKYLNKLANDNYGKSLHEFKTYHY